MNGRQKKASGSDQKKDSITASAPAHPHRGPEYFEFPARIEDIRSCVDAGPQGGLSLELSFRTDSPNWPKDLPRLLLSFRAYGRRALTVGRWLARNIGEGKSAAVDTFKGQALRVRCRLEQATDSSPEHMRVFAIGAPETEVWLLEK